MRKTNAQTIYLLCAFGLRVRECAKQMRKPFIWFARLVCAFDHLDLQIVAADCSWLHLVTDLVCAARAGEPCANAQTKFPCLTNIYTGVRIDTKSVARFQDVSNPVTMFLALRAVESRSRRFSLLKCLPRTDSAKCVQSRPFCAKSVFDFRAKCEKLNRTSLFPGTDPTCEEIPS